MPRTSAYIVRLALAYLVAGTTLGALLLAGKGYPLAAWVWALRPFHVQFLLFGWMVQLVIGVAAWILPRVGKRRTYRSVVASAVLLNLGLWLVGWAGAAALPALWVLVGRVCEMAAMGALAYHVWPRVRAF